VGVVHGGYDMPTLFIAGDSTASIKTEDKRPESGWGEFLHEFITPNIKVENYAQNGRSTKSFINEGLLEQIENKIKEDDYLLIQFGHNDEKIEDTLRYTDPRTEYKDNLMRFVLVAKKHGAIPILLTSITRRKFADGKLEEHTVGDYPNHMKEFAKENRIDIIDAYKITHRIISQSGEDYSKKFYLHLKPNESKNYPNGVTDNTHLSPFGAQMIASLIAVELKKII
jgi:lysophospholipase L1-like esterase